MSVTAPTATATAESEPTVAGARRRPERPSLWHRPWFQRLVVWGGLLVIWQLAAWQAGPFFLPSLPDIADGVRLVVTEGDLTLMLKSYRQMLTGFGLAVAIGVPIGLVIGLSPLARAAVGWVVDVLFVTSLVALLPFLILLTGTDFSFRVTVVFLFAVFYLIMNPAAGVANVDPGLKEMTRAFGGSRWRLLRSVIAPSVLPFTFAGMRLGMGQAIQGMVVAELWISVDTGRRLNALGLARELGEFFAFAVFIVVAGVLLVRSLLWLQRWLTPWARDFGGVTR